VWDVYGDFACACLMSVVLCLCVCGVCFWLCVF